eukprot:225136_1
MNIQEKKICNLFITAKYPTFKEEMGNYKHLDINQYNNVITKAKKFIKTEIAKSTRAKSSQAVYDSLRSTCINMNSDKFGHADTCNTPRHYGISNRTPLSLPHLFAVVCYTDYSDLSSHFSATFRKNDVIETLQSLKNRNAVYFWMSKYLRELVEIYGHCSYGDRDKYPMDTGGWSDSQLNILRGPFYSGMSYKMYITQFAMRTCSPTSTSIHIEVATKFGGENGMIITLNNCGGLQYQYLRAFDCSWISQYKEEDERLFFGGFHRIKINGLILVQTKQNFKDFMAALHMFDNMLSGGSTGDTLWIFDKKKLKKYALIIKGLVHETKTFDNYIHSTFDGYTHQKTELVFELDTLNRLDCDEMRDLMFHPMDMRQIDQDKEIKKVAGDFRNLFRSEIFRIFPNIKTIIINTT